MPRPAARRPRFSSSIPAGGSISGRWPRRSIASPPIWRRAASTWRPGGGAMRRTAGKLLVFLAAWRIGAIACPFHVEMSTGHLRAILGFIAPKLVLWHEALDGEAILDGLGLPAIRFARWPDGDAGGDAEGDAGKDAGKTELFAAIGAERLVLRSRAPTARTSGLHLLDLGHHRPAQMRRMGPHGLWLCGFPASISPGCRPPTGCWNTARSVGCRRRSWR